MTKIKEPPFSDDAILESLNMALEEFEKYGDPDRFAPNVNRLIGEFYTKYPGFKEGKGVVNNELPLSELVKKVQYAQSVMDKYETKKAYE